MLEYGYIKIYRKITNWEWYSETNVFKVFLHLLITVNYEDKTWKGTVIKRGQRAVTISQLANELSLSQQQTRTALNKLKSTNDITIKTTSKYSVISVSNYDEYQDQQQTEQQTNNKEITSKSKTDNKRLTNEQQTNNNNVRSKENNNINNNYIYMPEAEKSASDTEVLNQKIFIELPLNNNSLYPISETQVTEYKELYPKVDIEQELRKMKGWLNANPKNRKTIKGINKFINGWLSREQDKGGTTGSRNKQNNFYEDDPFESMAVNIKRYNEKYQGKK